MIDPIEAQPPTGEPDAGDPQVRFGGRGSPQALPTPITTSVSRGVSPTTGGGEFTGETPVPVRAGARGIREVRVLSGPTKPGPKLNITASPRGGVESNGK